MVFDMGVPVAKDDAAPAVALTQISGLDEHIERAIALGVGKARDAVHLAYKPEVLIEVGFIDENLVNPQLLERQRVVLVLAVVRDL
jgi:hypothetical protein